MLHKPGRSGLVCSPTFQSHTLCGVGVTTNDLLRTLRVMDRLEEPHKHPDGFLKFQPADMQKKPIVFDKEFIPTVFYQ
jgi:hypothetical protein